MRVSHLPTRLNVRQRYVVAVVLGTALSTLGAGSLPAATVSENTVQAVANMSRYCTACWRNARLHPDSWSDCTQEVFSRLVQRITPECWGRVLKEEGDERREFFRAIDTVKKRTQRSRKTGSLAADVSDQRDLRERSLADERDAVAKAANAVLSRRQQRIMQLSFEGWQVQEIAAELGLTTARVSDEKYKAIHKLRVHLGVDA